MTPDLADILAAMEKYGGSFIKSLARTIRLADPINRQKLFKAFPEYIKHYTRLAQNENAQ